MVCTIQLRYLPCTALFYNAKIQTRFDLQSNKRLDIHLRILCIN